MDIHGLALIIQYNIVIIITVYVGWVKSNESYF